MKQKLLNSIRLRIALLVALLCSLGTGSVWADATVAVDDVLWTEPFKGTNTTTTFSATSSWGDYINPTTFVAADKSDLTYSSSNAMLSSTSSTNMDGAHVWLNKSVDGYIQVTGIKLYNATKVKVSWAQATSGSSTTVYYQFDGEGDFTELSTCSGPNAEFKSTELSVSDHTTIALKFAHPKSNGKNTRIDNLTLTVTEIAAAANTTAAPSIGGNTPFVNNTTVTITNAASADGAAIYYTLNGSDPTTTTSATCFAYSAPFTVDATTTVKAIAKHADDDNASTVTSETFTKVTPMTVSAALSAIDALADNGTIADQCVSGIVCTAGSLSSGAITYHISADGTETNRLQVYKGKGLNNADFEAAGDIAVGDEVVIYGTLKKYKSGSTTTPEFDQGSYLLSLVRKPAAPTFSPAAGAVVSGTQVALACLTDGATIYYTTNGSTPTTSSSVYSSAITVTENMTIKAIAVKNEVSSDVAEAAYTIALPVATPTFSPAAGTYSSAQSVTISTETADATIYYSYDNENWTAYTSAITVDETKTVYAKAEKTGMVTSAVASAEFTIHIPSITFSEATPKNLTYEAQTYDVAFTSEYTSGTLAAVLCDSEGNTTTYDWFSAAIVGGAVRVTLSKNEDTVNGRTAYFKVTADNATSAVFSVVQAKFVADYATLPFEWAGGASSDLDAVTGVSIDGIGSDYAAANAPYLVKFDNTGDYIQIKTDGQPGVVSIDVKMIGGATTSSITVKQSADGETFTDVETLSISGSANDVVNLETTNAFASTSRYVRLYFTKGSNVGVGPISIAKASTEPAIVAESSVDLDDTDTSGEITYSINNPDGVSSLTAATTTDWISNVAVDSENSKVTFTTTANTGAERVGTITLSYEGAVDKVITVTQAEYVVELTYNLVTSITSGKHYIISALADKAMGAQNTNNRAAVDVTNSYGSVTFPSNAGVTEFIIYGPDADGLYTIYDGTGYLYAASSSNNYLRTQANIDDNARWEITFDDEEDFASIVAVNSDNRNVMQFNSTLFSCYAKASQSAVYLYEKDGEATPTESVNVGAAGYTTYTTMNPVSSFPDGVTAYIATAVNPSTIHLEEVPNAPARTPLVIKATEDNYTLTSGTSTADVSSNILKSSDGTVKGNETSIYALGNKTAGVGFYLVKSGVSVPASKAYLTIGGGSSVKDFLGFSFGDETKITETSESIHNSECIMLNEAGAVFDLSGRRVSKAQKGLYILNGRKVLVK